MTVEDARAQRIACIAQMAANLEAGDRANPETLGRDSFGWAIPGPPHQYIERAQSLYRAVEALENPPETGT